MATKAAKKTAKKLNITPMGENVLLKRVEAETTTAGGIVLPDSAKEKPKQALVVAIGEGRLKDDGTRTTSQLKVNDTVIFSSYAGTEIDVDGADYLIVREDEILAVIA